MFAAMLLAGLPAAAQQPIDPAALAQCLTRETTPDEIDGMRRLMIAALESDLTAMQAEVDNVALALVSTATSRCGVRLAQVEDPAFRQATVEWGQRLGERIMAEALAKMEMTKP